MLSGVNLSSNAYPTGLSPRPSIPSPLAGRGGFGFRQNRGGVTRILMVGDLIHASRLDKGFTLS